MVGKTGAARIALETGCPVIPVGQWGAQECCRRTPRGRDLFPRKRITMKAGDPVDLERPRRPSRAPPSRQRGHGADHGGADGDRRRAPGRASRRPSGSTRARRACSQIGNPQARTGTEQDQHEQGRGVRRRVLGHGVLDRARRRRQRRDHLGAPRGGLRRRSTTGTRTPTTCPASSCRRRLGDPRPREGRCTAPTWSCSPCRRRRCARTSPSGRRPDPADAVMVSLMKGVELGTLKRMSEVIAEVTGAGPGADRRRQRPQPVQGDRPPRARRLASSPAPTRTSRRMLQDALPLAGVPALHQRRRARLRARRRLQERRRPRGRHGRRPRASATTPPPRSSPAAWPRPPGWRWRSAPTR